MGFGIRLQVWGERACFTRPEMKAERVSYDVMTPSAARGILEAIHWKPAIRWVIDRIHVLNPIVFGNIRRNEVEGKIAEASVRKAMKGESVAFHQQADEMRQQRATLFLTDVAYIIEAHFEMTAKAKTEDNPQKHYNMFLRRAREGQCFHRPCLGCREFPAHFQLLEGDNQPPASSHTGRQDLGWMLLDIDYVRGMAPEFFRAELVDGVMTVPPMAADPDRSPA